MKWAPQSHYCVTFTVARKAARFSGVARMRLGVGRQGAHTVCASHATTPRAIRATPENRAVFRATVKRDTIVTLRSPFHLKQAQPLSLLAQDKSENQSRGPKRSLLEWAVPLLFLFRKQNRRGSFPCAPCRPHSSTRCVVFFATDAREIVLVARAPSLRRAGARHFRGAPASASPAARL